MAVLAVQADDPEARGSRATLVCDPAAVRRPFGRGGARAPGEYPPPTLQALNEDRTVFRLVCENERLPVRRPVRLAADAQRSAAAPVAGDVERLQRTGRPEQRGQM